MKKAFGVLILAVIVQSNCFAQQTNWQFVKETNGVKVYFRETPGNPIKEVKILTTFNAPINSIISALTDVDSYPSWVYGALESRVVKRISTSEMMYYNKLDFPWPLTDRDILIHTRIIKEGDMVYSVSEAKSDELSPSNDLVRITRFKSKWAFKPIGNRVQAEYVFSSDPGGNIPVWMINLALDQGPLKTIQNFKKLMAKPIYRSTAEITNIK